MDLDDLLRSTDLMDCSGHVTHRLTLRLDGNVDVTFSDGHTAVVDPRARVCLTPSMTIPQALWPAIVSRIVCARAPGVPSAPQSTRTTSNPPPN